MKSIQEKAARLAELHAGPKCFVIPNPWDTGSARVLEALGFEALASSSAGFAFTTGQPDMGVTLEAKLAHLREVCAATSLPVSADLQNGFGDRPEDAAECIRRAAQAGVVGGSIEDATGNEEKPIYDFQLAVERVQAAVETARALPFPFVLAARAENFLHGRRDLDDTIRRLQAFEKAGADVLYAPGLRDLPTIRTVVASVTKPLNVVVGMLEPGITADQLASAGVKRISVGGALSRLVLAHFVKGAREMKDRGSFSWMAEALSLKELQNYFA